MIYKNFTRTPESVYTDIKLDDMSLEQFLAWLDENVTNAESLEFELGYIAGVDR